MSIVVHAALRLNHRKTTRPDSAFRNATGFCAIMNHERRQQRIRSAASAIEHTRRARIAPLLAAGMSVRAIAAETGIPVGAVQQLEKGVAQGRQNATAIAQQLPTNYVVKQNVGGIPHDVRRLTASVFERAVESAIGRGFLERSNRNNPWAVINAFWHVR